MGANETNGEYIYKVVVNHEEQYSIWWFDRENAYGWSDAGKSGTKEECLAYIEEVWTDMRPLSLRQKMAAQEKAKAHATGSTATDYSSAGPATGDPLPPALRSC
jgi:MbtH protein